MILAYLLLLTGLTISSVAIYYSVAGLTAIFSAAAVPIMVMGISLELAKLVCATWIKAYWARVPKLMRTYMLVAITVLMLITSMGIFGFLSKAHNDQNLVSGDVQSKIFIYDEKIKTAKENIEADRKQLKQMDEAVDQVMSRSTSEGGADKAVAIRRSQARDRAALAKDIESNQKIVAQLNDEAAPIRAEVRKVDAEVGPIKYIAAFLYGTTPDASMLERAVTWIIIMIVIVFDPLAVIMLLASQMTFDWRKEIREARARADNDGMVDSDPTIMPPPKTIFNVVADKLEKRINDFHAVRERFKSRPKSAPVLVEPKLEPVPEHVTTNISAGSEYALTDSPALEPVVETIEIPDEYFIQPDAVDIKAAHDALIEELLIDEPIAEPEVVDEYPFRGKGLQPSMPMTPSYIQPTVKTDPEPAPVVESTPFTFELIEDEPPETPTEIVIDLTKDREEPDYGDIPLFDEIEVPEPEPIVEEPVFITRIAVPESNIQTTTPAEELTWVPATQVDADTALQQLKEAGYLTETGEINPEYVPDETGIAPEEEEEVKFYPMDERPGDYIEPPLVASIVADNALPDLGEASRSDFGNQFPANPKKGDTYLRTDFLPNRLFKFNDFKWIEVDKNSTDVYAYEEAYIKHLINQIDAGMYDIETLTETEKQQIQEYLNKN